uniref:Peptidase A2 domain-containing protein n=1 Tax=Strongyloides papillosus TaxID=174720 RepID=A0A0N5CBD2_STREA
MQIETARLLLRSYRVRDNPDTFKKECQEYSKLLDQVDNLSENDKIAKLMGVVDSDLVFNKLSLDCDKYASYNEAVLQCENLLKTSKARKLARREKKSDNEECSHCKHKGHMVKNCRFKKKGLPSGDYTKKNKNYVSEQKATINNVYQNKDISSNLLVVNLNGFDVQSLLDTGATKTIICGDTASNLGLVIDPRKEFEMKTLGMKNF